ncbi:MAG: 50S ribosomal protein L25 [Anaerolineae bacterium]|nr:50S ribosomal protein L25 [Anaerolineae bacterium]
MANPIVLEATKRELTGKQVKQLRAEGLIPGVLYGPTFDPIPLQVNWLELRPVLREAGSSHLIQLNLGDERHNALVRLVQRNPLRGDVLHVDFYRVRMDVAIRTEVPLVLVGSAEALEEAGGVVNHEVISIMVECLPGDLPAHVELDISGLKEVGDVILATALPELPGVTYLVDSGELLVSTSYLTAAEEEETMGEVSAEPELIRRREEDEDEGK